MSGILAGSPEMTASGDRVDCRRKLTARASHVSKLCVWLRNAGSVNRVERLMKILSTSGLCVGSNPHTACIHAKTHVTQA